MEFEMEHMDLELQILASFTTVTAEDCNGWIDHNGIYT